MSNRAADVNISKIATASERAAILPRCMRTAFKLGQQCGCVDLITYTADAAWREMLLSLLTSGGQRSEWSGTVET